MPRRRKHKQPDMGNLMSQPDIIHFKMGDTDCYILRDGDLYKAQYGTRSSFPVKSWGGALDWIMVSYNKYGPDAGFHENNALLVLEDASGLYDEQQNNEKEPPQEREGFPHK